MTGIRLLILLACTLLLFAAGSSAQPSGTSSRIDSTLQHIESLYSSGAYPEAELEARRLMERSLVSDSIRAIAEQWVAFSLVAQTRPAPAREHFLNILRRTPAYEPDPILTSPKILTVFNEARAAFRALPPQEKNTTAAPPGITTAGITFRTILFPGWEQLYHERTAVGTAFLAGGVAALGTGLTLELMRSSARKDYLSATGLADIQSKYNRYNRVRRAEQWAFAALGAIYIASEIDVFLNTGPVSLTLQPKEGAGAPLGAMLMLRVP